MDLKLQVDTYVPGYYWDLDLAVKRGPRDLGSLELIKGASIAGFVVDPEGTPVKPGTGVELRSANGEEILGAHVPTGTRERGFFQIAPVAPAAYLIRAAARERFAEYGITVDRDIEHFLSDPLVLSPPLELEVQIRPPVPPSGDQWGIQVMRMRPSDPRTIDEMIDESSPVPPSGMWLRNGLSAGTYQITVLGGSGTSRIATQVVSMTQSERAVFDLPVVEVTGSLTLGKTPLRGTVVFGGQFGMVSVPLQSNDEGELSGYLYQAEPTREWQVSVHSTLPLVRRSIERVPVEVRDGKARVDISLPANRIKGHVVTRDRLPFAAGGAVVSFRGTTGSAAEERANWLQLEKGQHQFVIEGLPPGTMIMSARAGTLRSKEMTVVLGKEDEAKVTLALEPTTAVRFEVRGEGGDGLPGARIKYLPADAPDSGAPTVSTGVDGTVELHLTPGTREVLANVWTPGYAYSIGRYSIGDDKRVVIDMHRFGGALELTGVKDPANITDEFPLLVANGSWESVRHLRSWARTNGGADLSDKVLIPSLAAGRYSLCMLRRSDLLALVAGALSANRCSSTIVSPGVQATLSVSVPR